jgi:DNA-binding protein YbaB
MDPSIEALAAQARAALGGRLPVDNAQPEPAARETASYTGSAAGGLVTAEVGSDGRVRSLAIDPTMLQRPLADVAAAAQTAINAALDARPGRVDYAPLADELKTVQDTARTDLAAITQAMAEVAHHVRVAREDGGAGGSSEPASD